MFFWQSNGCGGYFEQSWTKSGAVFLLFSCSQFMGKKLKRHYIFGGNTDRGVIPPRQFLPNISLSIERSFIILLPPQKSSWPPTHTPKLSPIGRAVPDKSMEWIELLRSSPVQIQDPLILIQSSSADDPEPESSPVQSRYNRVGICQIPCKIFI